MALSPDGRTLAVAVADPTWLHVFLVDLRSGSARRLTDAPCDFNPAWSKDGRTIAFLDEHLSPTLIARNGQSRRKIPGGYTADDSLQWTTGRELIYGTSDINGFGGDQSFSIEALPARGGDQTELNGHGRFPALSPDESHLAYVSETTNDMYLAAIPGGRPRRILHEEGMSSLAWSPDGRWIAFHTPNGINLMNPDGHEARLLIDKSSADTPVWLPDSQHLLYSDHNSQRIYTTGIQQDDSRSVIDLSTIPTAAP